MPDLRILLSHILPYCQVYTTSIPHVSGATGDHLAIDDTVFGMSTVPSGMLRSRAMVHRHSGTCMPQGVTFEQAAHMPTVFMTAAYAMGLERSPGSIAEDTAESTAEH